MLLMMHFVTLLLAALHLPFSVIAAPASTSTFSASAWIEDWNKNFTVADINFDDLNSVTYAFAVPTPNASEITYDPVFLKSLVDAAHSHSATVSLSFGGYGGSKYFSDNINAANAPHFVAAIKEIVTQYKVDGVEFDWEFPNENSGCNKFSSDDTTSYLEFFKLLRKNVGNIDISAVVGIRLWTGPDGKPLTNASSFAAVLDSITVMNYDCFGSWSDTAGPNSPLEDSCAPTANQQCSATFALKAWTDAGFSASQITLGVASYGHSFTVSPHDAFNGTSGGLAIYAPADKTHPPHGDTDPAPGKPQDTDQCGKPVGPSGTYSFDSLISSGFLTSDGTNATGTEYFFDQCSETPMLYNADNNLMISFDNPTSFAAKGNFIVDKKLKGYKMWYEGGNKNDLLAKAINKAMGFSK